MARPVPVPVPTPTPPKPKPSVTSSTGPTAGSTQRIVPSSTPSIPSNNVNTSSGGYANGGWYQTGSGVKQYWNGQWYDTPQQGVQQSSGDSGYSEPSIDWDAIYRPQFEALDQAVNVANENYNLSVGDVDRTKEASLREVATEEEKARGFFDEGTQRATKNKESAYSDAVRYFNALQQRAKAQFGRGNSAGGAIGELSNQEFLRNQGNIEESYAQIYKDLEGKWQDAVKTYSATRLKIDEFAVTQMSNLKKELNNQLLNIQMSRAQTEADKTAKRQEVLNRALEQTRAINLQKQQQQQALDVWKQQQEFLIQNKLVPIYNQTLNTSGYTPTTSTVSNPTQTQGGTSVISTLRWNPNTKSFVDDENKPLQGLSYTA